MSATYATASFSAPSARARRFSRIVAARAEAVAPRVLDLGCGSGELVIAVARLLPGATLVGVDVSRPNIAVARRTAEDAGLAGRVRFLADDVMAFEDRPFDLIASWSTLHLIPVPTLALFQRIADLLAPGGRLVNAMPFRCGYNTLLTAVRAAFRALRCGPLDRLALASARRVAGADYDEAFYRERLLYLYTLPRFYSSPALDRRIEAVTGLRAVERLAEKHSSAAQMKHRITVYLKAGDA